jgi:hypothetical protein
VIWKMISRKVELKLDGWAGWWRDFLNLLGLAIVVFGTTFEDCEAYDWTHRVVNDICLFPLCLHVDCGIECYLVCPGLP